MKKMILTAFSVSILLLSLNVESAAQWYRGNIKRVTLNRSDGSFIVTLKNDVLADCKWKYVHYDVSKLGAERVKAAYSMALLAFSTNTLFGTVIDKGSRADGENCYAIGMAADINAS
jgi:hypothetical protein